MKNCQQLFPKILRVSISQNFENSISVKRSWSDFAGFAYNTPLMDPFELCRVIVRLKMFENAGK